MKKTKSEAGKMGAEKRWTPSKYEILTKLSAYHDKHFQNQILGWPRKYLKELLVHLEGLK